MKISFHTDAFNTSFKSFDHALNFASKNTIKYIECGVIEGACWIQGLGYFPHISLLDDPIMMKEKMQALGIEFSQIDAAYPLSNPEAPYVAVPYILNAMRWAKLVGCKRIATTDGLDKPDSMDEKEAMAHMKRQYLEILRYAEKYEIFINIEVHGYFTTNPEMLEEMLAFSDSPYLGLNLDTGNSFIAGRDPVAFAKQFIKRINHVHIKDVSEELAAALRGEDTGIALSQSSAGEGVNAGNIVEILKLLKADGYNGHLSLECDGFGGSGLLKSVNWLRARLAELGIKEG